MKPRPSLVTVGSVGWETLRHERAAARGKRLKIAALAVLFALGVWLGIQ